MKPLMLPLHALAKCLEKQKIKYAILGGMAVAVYGEPRLTADIDAGIVLDKDGIDEFLRKAKAFGLYAAFADAERIAKETGVLALRFRKGNATGKVDLILAENLLEFAAIQRGRSKKIGLIRARLISPEDLVIHKIASHRPRDYEDLKGILIRQRGKLDIRYIERWLNRIDEICKDTHLRSSFRKLLKEL